MSLDHREALDRRVKRHVDPRDDRFSLAKVKAIALWHALAHNLLRAASLRAAVAGAT